MVAGVDLVTARLGRRGPTIELAVAVSFAGTGSSTVDDMTAVLVTTVPGTSDADGSTLRVMSTGAPGASAPRLHTTGDPAQVAPAAEMRVTPGGSESVSVTEAATDGPLFVTRTG